MRVDPITEFRGEFEFLSNFHHNPFTWRGIEFPTGEHAFSYAKTLFLDVRESQLNTRAWQRNILEALTPNKVKRLGRAVPLNVAEWDKHKVQYMREIVHARFLTSERSMIGPLINTGAAMLVEGNTWNDTFWGRCNGKGKNILGAILMEERGYWLKGDY